MIKKALIGAALSAVTLFSVPTIADASQNVNIPFGRLTVIDVKDTRGPGGEITVKYKDNKRDGSCVRGVLVNEDGSVFSMGRQSCGKWVKWTTWTPAEDWPRAGLYHIETGDISIGE